MDTTGKGCLILLGILVLGILINELIGWGWLEGWFLIVCVFIIIRTLIEGSETNWTFRQ
jgi:hypothetical protein